MHPALPWLQLLRTPGLGNADAVRLLQHFGSPAAVLAAPRSRWQAVEGSARTAKAGASPAADDATVLADLAWLAQPQAQLVGYGQPGYPPLLIEASNPPLVLFVLGNADLLSQPQLAIVGARTATPQGLDNARAFARSLAERGLLISSGLALGVDGAAHQGALDAKAPTLAVCATGLDRVYPARHRDLARKIVETGGALVSEFAPGTAAVASHFPRRNRVLAGLALGTLVVEASVESGSLITARLAGEMGREVFAIPGSIHNPLARGCHRLIRDGAQLVESVDDILLALAPKLSAALRAMPVSPAPTAAPQPPTEAAAVLAALRDAPETIDTLIARTGLAAQDVQAQLLMLELEGRVGCFAGRYQLASPANNR